MSNHDARTHRQYSIHHLIFIQQQKVVVQYQHHHRIIYSQMNSNISVNKEKEDYECISVYCTLNLQTFLKSPFASRLKIQNCIVYKSTL